MAKQLTNESNTYAVASLVCAIASWLIFGIILAPLSVVFGCMSLGKNERSKGLAIAGLIIGSIALAVLIFSWIIIGVAASYR